jgi:uncharacterized membrane protein YkgB
MRVLGSAVLGIEAIIVMLATLVAANGGTVERPELAYAAGGALMVAMIVTIGFLKRPWGVWVGWILQGLLLAFGFVVPSMWVVGAIFAVLWWLAVRNGRRVDELRAGNAS